MNDYSVILARICSCVAGRPLSPEVLEDKIFQVLPADTQLQNHALGTQVNTVEF